MPVATVDVIGSESTFKLVQCLFLPLKQWNPVLLFLSVLFKNSRTNKNYLEKPDI